MKHIPSEMKQFSLSFEGLPPLSKMKQFSLSFECLPPLSKMKQFSLSFECLFPLSYTNMNQIYSKNETILPLFRRFVPSLAEGPQTRTSSMIYFRHQNWHSQLLNTEINKYKCTNTQILYNMFSHASICRRPFSKLTSLSHSWNWIWSSNAKNLVMNAGEGQSRIYKPLPCSVCQSC